MMDRGYQERTKQYKPGDSETAKQKRIYDSQQQRPAKQQQPQPMYQANQQGTYAGNTETPVYALQGQAPHQYQQQPQQHDSNYNDPNNEPPADGTTEWASSAFSDKRIRQAFIRKVYLILTAMLLVTLVFICIFLFVKPVKQWVQEHPWVMWISIGVYFIVSMVLICCQSVRRAFPANYICLIIFNLAFAYVCAAISSYYSTQVVLIAIGITTLVCLSISIFAIQTKIDFTLCHGVIFVISILLMIFGLVVMFVFIFAGRNYILQCVYGAVVALAFSLFLAYDTQIIIGGRKHQLSPEEYIYGALTLYLDVGTMFLVILSFFSGK